MNFSGNEGRISEILGHLDLGSLDELFSQIPESLRYPELDMNEGLEERDLRRMFAEIGEKNSIAEPHSNFSGGGFYYHFIPSVVDYIASMGSFATAYTPYQPEVSQGTLQTLFEYQTYIGQLTGMDAVNASHYDGATAFAEAARLMLEANRKKGRKLYIASALHPEYREILETYLMFTDAEIVYIDLFDETFPVLPEDCASVSVILPDYYGRVADVARLAAQCHEKGILFHMHADPLLLASITPPAEIGVDVYTGEGQVLGNPVNFGGPYLGLFAVQNTLLRRMPGRIAGETVDDMNRRGFVLALSTREQHIRREKASSNICTNQGLMALRSIVYMAAMGRDGLESVSRSCIRNVHNFMELVKTVPGLAIDAPEALHFREVRISCEFPVDKIFAAAKNSGVKPGIRLSDNEILVSITEIHRNEDIEQLAKIFREGATS